MEAHLMEWLNLVVRWLHMITGIAWIGASFYFVWLENNLERANAKPGLSGDLWAIHGGGIYHLEKYKLAPPQLPDHLHWFKWEAYGTWITGMLLLAVVYYFNAELYLVGDIQLGKSAAIILSLVTLGLGWVLYTLLCDSPLRHKPFVLGIVLYLVLVAIAFGLTQVYGGRAAYIHVGALIGTIMVGNVFFIIMPAQRALVDAVKEQREPDPVLPAKGLLRSRHNNYFTLPVLFIMISNHFPSTYGSTMNWLILAALSFVSILVRHYFNTRHENQKFAWTFPVAALALVALAFVTAPKSVMDKTSSGQAAKKEMVNFSEIYPIIQQRCTVCHSESPSSPLFTSAPAGLMLDHAEQIHLVAEKIYAQTVSSQIMPLGNMTQMTQEERDLLGMWIKLGANIK